MIPANLQTVAPNSQVQVDGYHEIDWKVPEYVHHSHRKRLYLTTSGQWKNGKLNGAQCKMYVRSIEDCPNGGSIMKTRNDLPQLIGTFKDSIIEKSTIKLDKQWKFEFDSIQLSTLNMSHNYYLRWPRLPISRFMYDRYFIFENANWSSHCNKLKCNGSFITKINGRLEYTHPLPSHDDDHEHIVVECCEFSLLYYDLLLSFIKHKCEIFKGTIEYIFDNCFNNCNVSYTATINETLTTHRYRLRQNRNNPRGNEKLTWKIGKVNSDTESQKTGEILNQSIQTMSLRSYPAIKLEITFIYDNINLISNSIVVNHQHNADTKCFLGIESQCPFEQFSFIPSNPEKLFNFLKTSKDITLIPANCTTYKSMSVIFSGDAEMDENIGDCGVKFDMSGKCTIQVCAQFDDHEQQQKEIRHLLFDGYYHGSQVSITSVLAKLLKYSCNDNVHDNVDDNVNKNQIQPVYNEIQQLQQLGFEFGMEGVDCGVIFDKIKQTGIDAVCDCLKRALVVEKYDLNDLKSWLETEYAENGDDKLDWSLTPIQWEKLYQTGLISLIEYALECKQECGTTEVESWIINDTQNWNILHYGAYLNNIKMIEIGQKYMETAGMQLDQRKTTKVQKKQRKFVLDTRNLYESQDIGGNTPLHIASQYGNVESLNKLINFQYDSKCFKESIKNQLMNKNLNGETPLSVALRYDSIKCVKLLFKKLKFKSNKNKLVSSDFNGFSVFTLLVAS